MIRRTSLHYECHTEGKFRYLSNQYRRAYCHHQNTNMSNSGPNIDLLSLTHCRLGDFIVILNMFIKIPCSYCCLKYFLGNCSRFSSREPHSYHINVGSCNGLVPSDNKALTESMLIQLCHMSSLGHTEISHLYVSLEVVTLLRRHNGCDGISNHQHYDRLLNHSFRRRSKKTSKLRVTGLCAGNSPVTGEFPAQRASDAENASIWWRHHGFYIMCTYHCAFEACHSCETITMCWGRVNVGYEFPGLCWGWVGHWSSTSSSNSLSTAINYEERILEVLYSVLSREKRHCL